MLQTDVHLKFPSTGGGSGETPLLGMRRALVSEWEVANVALILVFHYPTLIPKCSTSTFGEVLGGAECQHSALSYHVIASLCSNLGFQQIK